MASHTEFVKEFNGKTRLTSSEFVEIFKKYDTDNNGFIEHKELDAFLSDLLKVKGDEAGDLPTLKKIVLEKYDKNSDSKISISELALILPTEDNFLEHFREENVLHIADFMKIWYHYDNDKSGYLESNELKGFLRDLLTTNLPGGKQAEVTPEAIDNYADVILDLFDKNKDGKIELGELAKILPVQENFFKQFHNKEEEKLTEEQFDKIFAHYDQDSNGFIEDSELIGLLRDILEKKNQEPTSTDLERFRSRILEISDANKDGKLTKEELKLFLLK